MPGKVCAYNDMVDSQFGLTQYEYIVKENGFIRYGEKVQSSTVCIKCGKTFEFHNEAEEEHYVPARFMTFKADLTIEER